ncbi:hypothetical protein C2S52_003997 [Perilla frutescens var. hirtella]|uniref:Uncharacterized protein n=1 Tax=Perilla frutescens var. hirtella TaxID=608512 RepID=A0AAD4JG81_PERFH|nr:hypothetical protein C2S51_011547 [Perilla frutescens var. frutescens]KAH6793520.1 hypothetical protein C2S52_003997 [Perilla frutescens var. hirtella]KAH6833197.1 hypothetical protein C2S53_008140 [Perilla frutescens var. hirtella]
MNYMFGNEECSSGCESGWTLYLEQSSISRGNDSPGDCRVFTDAKRSNDEDEDEDEDLSMVSDASSGPPHLHEEDEEGYGGIGNDKNGCFYNYAIHQQVPLSRNKLIKRNKINRENNRCRNKPQDHSSLLDDTASSPCNKTRSQPSSVENVVEYSQGYSTTQFEVRPPYQEHYDFFQSGNQLQQQNQLSV